MNRPLIVGQAPSRSSDPREPLSGRSGRRLADLCGLSLEEFTATFARVNLLDHYPGPRGAKGDLFPKEIARFSAFNLTARFGRRRTVLLGRAVARAFQFDAKPLRWVDAFGDASLVAACPHPSGASLWWNDPANVLAARRFWRALVRDAKPGP